MKTQTLIVNGDLWAHYETDLEKEILFLNVKFEMNKNNLVPKEHFENFVASIISVNLGIEFDMISFLNI